MNPAAPVTTMIDMRLPVRCWAHAWITRCPGVPGDTQGEAC
jgi:hypothetical protein